MKIPILQNTPDLRIRGETSKTNELQQLTNSGNPKDRLTADDLRIRGEPLPRTQAANPTLKALPEITLLSQSEMYQLRTRSITTMLLVMNLRMIKFHHLQDPDLDLIGGETKSELTEKPADALSLTLLQNTTSSHTFPKTPTVTSVAGTNQPELLVGLQRPQEVMLSQNPKHLEMPSPPITKS